MPDIGGNETIAIRVVGDSAGGVRAVNESAAAVTRLGGASRKAAGDFSLMSASAKRTERTVNSLTRSMTQLGKGAAFVGALGFAKFIADGIKFNAMMEQNKIAFTQFLGSAKAANKELDVLYQLAKTTPFEFKDVTLAARKFSAFGFSLKDTNRMLRTIADTASGLALDKTGIDRMVLAIGQIKSKGVLMAQDLRQLQELGAVDLSQLAKDLGLTAQEMGDVGKQGVPSVAALQALERQWNRTFGGQSLKQAYTFTGLLSTFKDNYRQLAGSLTTTPFDFSKTLFGKLNNALTEINDEYRKNPKLTLGAKIEIAKDKLEPIAKDIAKQVSDALGDAHLGDKIVAAMDAAIPVVAQGAGKLGVQAAKSFAKAFVEGDALTKLALGAFFISKFVGWGNIFRKLGKSAGKRFAEQFAASSAAGIGADVAANGAIGSAVASRSKWGKLGRIAGMAFGTAAAIEIGRDISQAIEDAMHSEGPNKGGRQDVTSGGQFSLSEWIAKQLGINQPKRSVGNDLGSVVKGIGKTGSAALGSVEAQRNAATIISVGRKLGASDKQILAALETGIVESGLHNLPYGDKDSVGVFQQRPSQGWKGLMNLPKAAQEFFQHAMQADRGGLSAGQLAQAVQRSQYPDRYDKAKSRALALLGGGRGGAGGGGPIKWKPIGGGGKDNTPVELAALNNAIDYLKKNFPDVGFLLENKGGANQHLHINSANHKEIREIARKLNEMGFNVGEYGGRPIPGVGGITTLKHKHYGAADHYHGGAIDVNADTLIKIFGDRKTKPPNVKVPAFSQQDFMDFVQSRLDHFDLMVQAGLMDAAKAVLEKRKAIQSRLPYLTGDNKLKALIMLQGLPVPNLPKTFNVPNQRNLAVAYANKNPGFMPEGGWERLGVNMTSENPFLQATMSHLGALKDAGKITGPTLDALMKSILEKALPFLAGDDKLKVEGLLKDIADNTAEAAEAIKQSGISSASFFSSLSGAAKDAVMGAIGPYAVDALPGGVSISQMIGNPQAFADFLRNVVLPPLMDTFRIDMATGDTAGAANVWAQIVQVLSQIASATDQTASNTQDLSDFWKQQAYRLGESLAVSQAQYGVFRNFKATPTPYLGGFDSGGIVPGPIGRPGFAMVHGGETILPTHKQQAPMVNVYVSAEAAAMGVRVDKSIGKDARQLQIAPGR